MLLIIITLQTLRDALSKAMKLRKLTPETCAVYRSQPPKNYLYFFTSLTETEISITYKYKYGLVKSKVTVSVKRR